MPLSLRGLARAAALLLGLAVAILLAIVAQSHAEPRPPVWRMPRVGTPLFTTSGGTLADVDRGDARPGTPAGDPPPRPRGSR